MGFQIEDGTGKGYQVGVNDENRILANCVSEDIQLHANSDLEEDYSIVADITTDSTDSHFLYIKNNNTYKLHITSINYFTSDDTELYILGGVTGTPTNSSDATVVNRNLGSGKVADADIKIGVDLQLSNGHEIDRVKTMAIHGSKKLTWRSSIIIPKNYMLVIASTIATKVNMTVNIFFHN